MTVTYTLIILVIAPIAYGFICAYLPRKRSRIFREAVLEFTQVIKLIPISKILDAISSNKSKTPKSNNDP